MKILVLLNDAAGTLASSKTRDEANRLMAAFRSLGVEAEVRAVAGADLGRVAREAASGDWDVVAAGGGDGTLNAVAAELVGTGKPFGILPLGTMNHLAKDLGIPFEIEEAAALLARGQAVELPVGEVNGRVFLGFSAIGQYARIVKHRDAQRSALGRGKWPAMAVAFLRTLRRFPLFRVRLTVNHESMARVTPMVFVGLSEYQMRMVGVEEQSCVGRRALTLYFARKTGRLGMLVLLLRALFRRLRPASDFEALCVTEAMLKPPGRYARVALDGEVIDLPTPLHYRLCPRVLRVVVPAAAQ